MKTTIFKQLTTDKHFAFKSRIAGCMLLCCLLFAANNVFAADGIYAKVPPKVTASIDCAPSINLAAIQPIASGNWNDATIWPNNVLPTAEDDITIPSGITVTLGETCRAKSIRVEGVLNAGNQRIDLQTESIVVAGKMEIGTIAKPYDAEGKCLITLIGDKVEGAEASYKAIFVEGGGTLELHGKKRKSWTNIATTAEAGDTQIILKEAVEWEVGDVIALTSTDLALDVPDGVKGAWENVDQVEIAAISADRKTLTLETALQYRHVGGTKSYTRATDGKTWDADIYAEVGLLSHYIKIQGDVQEEDIEEGFGGHIMLMLNSTAHVEHVELYRMGQKGLQGRYPFHWHLNEDKSQSDYLKNSSIHKSFNRAVTIHGTDYVTVDGVFAYDHIGHGIFLEDGSERFNTIKNNVVFVTRRPKQGEQLTPSDNFSDVPNVRDTPQNRTPASYWITNPNNYFENNVAAGTEGTGFWLALPEAPMLDNEEERNNPHFMNINPVTENLGSFEGFVAHSCMNGWDIFDRLRPDHSILRNLGWDIATRQLFKNGIFYANDQAIYCGLGVGGETSNVVFYDCVFSDNKTVTMLAGNLTIENSLFNVDAELGVFNGVREFFRFYDGPGRHIDCHFEGWNRQNAEMIKQLSDGGGGATENFNPTFEGTTKGFSEPFRFKFGILADTRETRPRKIGQFFKDYDGGLTGKANTTLIRDIPFLTDGHEFRDPSWENAVRSDYFFAGLWFALINETIPISVVRSKPGTEDVCFWESGFVQTGTYKFPLIVNQDFTYTYHFNKVPESKRILVIWYRGEPGDLALTCYKGLGNLGNFRMTGSDFDLKALDSKEAVESATETAYFIAENGDVYLKLRNRGSNDRDRVNIFFDWDDLGTFQPVEELPCTSNILTGPLGLDNDGDTRPNVVENEACGNPESASDFRFDFNQSDEGFQKINFSECSLDSEEYWVAQVNQSNDPYIVRGGLSFNGSEVPQLKIRIKSEAAGAYQLFWGTDELGGFAPNRSVTVAPQATNEFEELVFDMSTFDTWMGQTITRIRLDFPPDTTTPTKTFIDYIHGPDATRDFCTNDTSISFNNLANLVLTEGDDLGVVVTVNSGNVANVSLYANDVLVRQDNEAPYEWGTADANEDDTALINLAPGPLVLKAVATNTDGNVATVTELVTVVPAPIALDLPGTIEAENFTTKGGPITAENTPGTNGGQNLGFILDGTFTEYFVNVLEAGMYDFTIFASSAGSGGTVEIYSQDVLLGSVEIPITGAWHSYEPFATKVELSAGEQTLRLVNKNSSGGFLFNVDRFVVGDVPPSVPVVDIPGIIEAEFFVNKTGPVTAENTPGTDGGQNIGFILNGTATEYLVNVSNPRDFDFTVYASSAGAGGTVDIYSEGSLVGSVEIPVNGAWHSYEGYTTRIVLPAGRQTLRLEYVSDSETFLFNIDRFEVDVPVINIPGVIEAEDFADKTGLVRAENTPGTDGGQNIGFVLNGTATEYSVNVTTQGDFDFTVFASSAGAGGTVEIYSEDILIGSVEIPVNGAWHSYQPYTTRVPLALGEQTLRLVYTSASETFLFNIDRFEVDKALVANSITGFSLINASADNRVVGTLENGAVIDVNVLGSRYLSFAAHTYPEEVGSVYLALEGPVNATRTENLMPYTMFGDIPDLFFGKIMLPGSYTLSATPYTESRRNGEAGETVTIQFTIVDDTTVAAKTLGVADDTPRPTQLTLYPNPLNDQLFITGDTAGKLIEVYSLLGVLQVRKELVENENTIDFSSFASGYYLLKITDSIDPKVPVKITRILKK